MYLWVKQMFGLGTDLTRLLPFHSKLLQYICYGSSKGIVAPICFCLPCGIWFFDRYRVQDV